MEENKVSLNLNENPGKSNNSSDSSSSITEFSGASQETSKEFLILKTLFQVKDSGMLFAFVCLIDILNDKISKLALSVQYQSRKFMREFKVELPWIELYKVIKAFNIETTDKQLIRKKNEFENFLNSLFTQELIKSFKDILYEQVDMTIRRILIQEMLVDKCHDFFDISNLEVSLGLDVVSNTLKSENREEKKTASSSEDQDNIIKSAKIEKSEQVIYTVVPIVDPVSGKSTTDIKIGDYIKVKFKGSDFDVRVQTISETEYDDRLAIRVSLTEDTVGHMVVSKNVKLAVPDFIKESESKSAVTPFIMFLFLGLGFLLIIIALILKLLR